MMTPQWIVKWQEKESNDINKRGKWTKHEETFDSEYEANEFLDELTNRDEWDVRRASVTMSYSEVKFIEKYPDPSEDEIIEPRRKPQLME